MSFHDDSHILSRLGILDSLEASPRRCTSSPTIVNKKDAKEKDSFVDVSIGVDSDADNEGTTLDQDTLLTNGSKSKVLRRQPESFRCRYLLLIVSYLTLGVMYQTAGTLFRKKMFSPEISCIWHPFGVIIGIIVGRAAVFQVDSSIIFLSVYFFSTVLISAIQILNFSLFALFQGIFIGVMSYTSLTTYFSLWRGHHRKLIWFFALLSLGSATTLLFKDTNLINHDITEPAVFESTFLNNKSHKPDIITEQLVAKKKRGEPMQGVNENYFQEGLNRTLNATATTMEVTMESNKTVIITPERSPRNKNRYSLSVPMLHEFVPNTPAKIFILVVLLTALCLHVVGLMCCCEKQKCVSPDSRILKLRDITQQGLTTGCRAHLFTFYILYGIAEGLLVLYLSSATKDHKRTYYCISFIVRFLAILPGPPTYSALAICLTAATALFSSISLALGLAVNVNTVIICATVGFLPICTFLNIETRLCPNPIMYLDSFLLSYSLGQFISVFCWMTDLQWLTMYISIVVGLLNLSLYFLMRVVMKSARLKDIMEYTTPHGTLEEYLTLVDQDRFSSSDIDHYSNDEL